MELRAAGYRPRGIGEESAHLGFTGPAHGRPNMKYETKERRHAEDNKIRVSGSLRRARVRSATARHNPDICPPAPQKKHFGRRRKSTCFGAALEVDFGVEVAERVVLQLTIDEPNVCVLIEQDSNPVLGDLCQWVCDC
eukprot:2806433-Rhodomonas_salina.1